MTRWEFGLIFLLAMLWTSCDETMKKGHPFSLQEIEQKDTSDLQLPFPVQIDTPQVNDSACTGIYRGVEFVNPHFIDHFELNGTDIAHQYSNKMCEYVGKYLKKRFTEGHYLRVKLNQIKMKTKGMDDEDNYVEYSVVIPFESCDKAHAMTAFDHSGGWGHKPDLKERKMQLLKSPKSVVWGKRLYISRLYATPEGLQEYWIQWKHTDFH